MSDSSNQATKDAVAYKFGDYVICLRQRILAFDGEPMQVETRVFNVLSYLIAHRDRAVSKEELEDAVWRGRPLSETVLARSIMKARQALGDDPEQQNYIRTVRGFGYQFVGDVEIKDASHCEARWRLGIPQVRQLRDKLVSRRGLIASALLAVALVSGLGVMSWQQTAVTQSPALKLAVEPVSNGTADKSLDSTVLRLTAMLDRELSELPRLDVITVSDGAMSRELGSISVHCPILKTELNRNGADYHLKFYVRSAGEAGISGQVSGHNPRELAEQLIQRVREAVEVGKLPQRNDAGSS